MKKTKEQFYGDFDLCLEKLNSLPANVRDRICRDANRLVNQGKAQTTVIALIITMALNFPEISDAIKANIG